MTPRSRGTEAYFELAGEFLARNGIESPRSSERIAAAAGQVNALKVRFWLPEPVFLTERPALSQPRQEVQ